MRKGAGDNKDTDKKIAIDLGLGVKSESD